MHDPSLCPEHAGTDAPGGVRSRPEAARAPVVGAEPSGSHGETTFPDHPVGAERRDGSGVRSPEDPSGEEPEWRMPARSHRALLVHRLLTVREDTLAAHLDLALDELRPFTDPRQYARGLDPEEIAVVAALAERLRTADGGSPPGLGEFLAFTAYRPVREAPGRPELADLPGHTLLRALPFLLEPPQILEREGDASRFACHLEWVLSTVERHLAKTDDAALAAPILDICLRRLSCMSVYACDEPLVGLYRTRGRLVARYANLFAGNRRVSPQRPPPGRTDPSGSWSWSVHSGLTRNCSRSPPAFSASIPIC